MAKALCGSLVNIDVLSKRSLFLIRSLILLGYIFYLLYDKLLNSAQFIGTECYRQLEYNHLFLIKLKENIRII